MSAENRLVAVTDAYDADMKLFNATLDLLRVCLNDGDLEEAMMVIDATQAVIKVPCI